MAALRAASANDSELHAEIAACQTVAELVAVAARHGFEFDASEFEAAGRELTEAELESASGGTLPETDLASCWNPRTNSWCTFMC